MKKKRSILFIALRVAIAVSLLTYLGLSGVLNWSSLHGLILVWPMTLAALTLLLVSMTVTAWRLCVLMKPRGLHLSLSNSVRLLLMGTFFNACLPGATSGDVVKIFYATEGNSGRRTEVTTLILLDRAAGMFALVIWPLLFAPFFPELIFSSTILQALLLISLLVAAALVLTVIVGSSTHLKSSRFADWALRKLPFGKYAEKILLTLEAYRHNKRTLLAVVLISLLAHTLTIGVALAIAQAINPTGFALQMSILIPLGFLANTLPLTPGGLGVGEAAFDKLFVLVGLTGGAEILVGWRLLAIVWGLLGLIFYLQGRRHFIQAGAA